MFKPLGQECLVDALMYLEREHIMDLDKSIKIVNSLDWSLDPKKGPNQSQFTSVTIKLDGSIDTGKGVRDRTTEFIKYLIAGNKLGDLTQVKREYNKAFNIDIDNPNHSGKIMDLPNAKKI